MRKSDARDRILAAAAEATESEGFITREELAHRSNLPQHIVDDHTGRMCDRGDLVRRTRGVFIHPAARRQDNPVSLRVLARGLHKIECGKQIMLLPFREAVRLKMALGGAGGNEIIDDDGDDHVIVTALLDGSLKIERGDDVIDLTPKEARLLRGFFGASYVTTKK